MRSLSCYWYTVHPYKGIYLIRAMPNKLGRTRGMGRDKSGSCGGYLKKDVKTLIIKEKRVCQGKEKNS